jgi:ribulose-phosphate 3-epimerase
MKTLKIAPSLLSGDFSRIGEEIKKLMESGAEIVHLDIMDGHFVPNITFGPKFVSDLRKHTGMIFDTHLMVENPNIFLERFAEAGSDIITVHCESVIHLDRTLEKIRSLGKKAGIALVPSTNEGILRYVLGKIDLVLAMTVNPGFGGQEFLSSQVEKIRKIKKIIDESGRDIDLEVDGGLDYDTCKLVKDAGANILVAGSYIFSGSDYRERINSLK